MAKRTYRSANGKAIDMDTLSLKNETVIAVGNMRVNARGDQLGPGGKIIRTREEVMSDHYAVRNSIIPEEKGQPRDPEVEQVQQQAPAPTPPSIQNKDIEGDPSGPLDEPAKEDEWVEDENGDFVRPEDLKASTKGISDALAEKKEVSVPREKTPKQKAKEQTGIKRI
tara:strand:- start:25 stop:528 length:504 start_codon:yes stop_codon:yes gene_type:complete